MNSKLAPDCKGCAFYWDNKIKNHKYRHWCIKHGRLAAKAVPHCKQTGTFKPKDQP